MKKKISLIIFLLFLITGCTNQLNQYNHNYLYMDTYINIKIYSDNKEQVNETFKEIDKIYNNYHQLTDRYNEYDDIVNIYYINNILENNEDIIIDEKLYDILEIGIDFYYQSEGLINITLGNVIDIWKEYKENNWGIPTYEKLASSGSINNEDIILKDNYTITKRNNVSIDLGTIAKGYATEEVGRYLEGIGLNKYLINAGGEVKVGFHYNNDTYKIGIENPKNPNDIYRVVSGNNITVATSGGYERYYEYDGKRYHHIIDPLSLFPPQHILSVTVITDNSTLGDLLSTMLFIMPIEKGLDYVNNLDNVEALWYITAEEIYFSKGYDKYE